MALSISALLMALCTVWLAAVMPWLDLSSARRLRQRSTSAGRLRFYRHAVAWLWAMALLVAAVTPWAGPWRIEPSPASNPWFAGHPSFRLALIVLLLAYFSLACWPTVHALLVPAIRANYLRALRRLQFVLPVSPQERRWWAVVSLTAGICEEWLYRGFLMQYLAGRWDGPNLGVLGALVISSVVFGLGHLYQGRHGVISTGIAGGFFGLLALVSGNLALPMLLHVLVDLQVLALYRPSLDDPAMAQALAEGCACE